MSMLKRIREMSAELHQMSIESKALSDEDAVEVRDELPKLRSSVNDLIKEIEKQIMDRAEVQPLQVGNKIISNVPKEKQRAHHDQIKNLICGRAQTDPDTGEIFPLEQAVRRAVDFVYSAFVTRAILPRKPFLREFGLKLEDVSFWEETGKDLVIKQAEK